jgi:hypothetical protein
MNQLNSQLESIDNEQITKEGPKMAEQPKEPKEKKISKLSILRDLLSEEQGYTMEELAELSGVKLSTVKCQIYFHLKNNGNPCEKLEGKKYRFLREEKLATYINDEVEDTEDEEEPVDEEI